MTSAIGNYNESVLNLKEDAARDYNESVLNPEDNFLEGEKVKVKGNTFTFFTAGLLTVSFLNMGVLTHNNKMDKRTELPIARSEMVHKNNSEYFTEEIDVSPEDNGHIYKLFNVSGIRVAEELNKQMTSMTEEENESWQNMLMQLAEEQNAEELEEFSLDEVTLY